MCCLKLHLCLLKWCLAIRSLKLKHLVRRAWLAFCQGKPERKKVFLRKIKKRKSERENAASNMLAIIAFCQTKPERECTWSIMQYAFHFLDISQYT